MCGKSVNDKLKQVHFVAFTLDNKKTDDMPTCTVQISEGEYGIMT